MATWKLGQPDKWHSHPPSAVYFLTDCEGRIFSSDEKFVDTSFKAGQAVVEAEIFSHAFENRGRCECRMLIVEHEV